MLLPRSCWDRWRISDSSHLQWYSCSIFNECLSWGGQRVVDVISIIFPPTGRIPALFSQEIQHFQISTLSIQSGSVFPREQKNLPTITGSSRIIAIPWVASARIGFAPLCSFIIARLKLQYLESSTLEILDIIKMTQAAPSSDNPGPTPANILPDSGQFSLPLVALTQVHLIAVIGQRCLSHVVSPDEMFLSPEICSDRSDEFWYS